MAPLIAYELNVSSPWSLAKMRLLEEQSERLQFSWRDLPASVFMPSWIRLSFESGLTPEVLHGICWSDVDLETGQIRVRGMGFDVTVGPKTVETLTSL